MRFVLDGMRRVAAAVAALDPVKAGALAALAEPAFWETPGRFAVLAKAEYLDRLQAATRTAERLAKRLERSTRAGSGSAELVQLLAARLLVLDSALEGISAADPFELFVDVRPSGDADASFAATIAGMYDAWGRRRGMEVERLSSAGGGHLLAVSGLGCWRLLHPEAGLHVLEDGESAAEGARAVDRETVRVTVVAHDPGPRDGARRETDARAAIRSAPPSNVVVRRYRTGPSPLVRDAVRGYRTGNLDRVLGGDFDLW